MGRLFELLSDLVTGSLGQRLLEILGKWVSPDGPVPKGQPVAWKPGEDAAVAAGILDLFHLLPKQVG